MDQFQLRPYLGTWYDVAHYPTLVWQKGCAGSMAEYTMIDTNTIQVKNTCLDQRGNVIYSRSGEARVADPRKKSHLRILFNDGLPADPEGWYIVEWTDYDRYAIVSGGEDYLWILSRTPQIPLGDVDMLLKKVKELGFKPDGLVTKPGTLY